VAKLEYDCIHEKALGEHQYNELKYSQESDQLSLPLDKGKGIEESAPRPSVTGCQTWQEFKNKWKQVKDEKVILQSKLDQMT